MSEVTDESGNPWHDEAKRKKRLNEGVNGAHCCIPFQCEECWFQNLEGQSATVKDRLYIMMLRRAQLDSMNGKSVHTINGHRRETTAMVELAGQLC